MQTSDRNPETKRGLLEEQTDPATCVALVPRPVVPRLLLSILGSGLLVIVGPSILRTVAHVSLLSIQILLEVGRLGLAAFQIFGT
jgi:hypothetical protein